MCLSTYPDRVRGKGAEKTVRSETISRIFSSNFRKQSFRQSDRWTVRDSRIFFTYALTLLPPCCLIKCVCHRLPIRPSVRLSVPPTAFGGPLQLSYVRQSTKGGHFIWVGGSFPPLSSSCADNRSGRRREGREFRTGKEGVGRLSLFFVVRLRSWPAAAPLRLPCYQIGSVAMASHLPTARLDWVPPPYTYRTYARRCCTWCWFFLARRRRQIERRRRRRRRGVSTRSPTRLRPPLDFAARNAAAEAVAIWRKRRGRLPDCVQLSLCAHNICLRLN